MKTTFNSTNPMRADRFLLRSSHLASVFAVSLLLGGCAATALDMAPVGQVILSGAEEVPVADTKATGRGIIRVANDRMISGSVTTTGIAATVAHVHLAPKGSNGPVIVPLVRTAENTWSIPPGAKLTDTQYADYVLGNLYVNVHSAAFPGGEIRGQINAN